MSLLRGRDGWCHARFRGEIRAPVTLSVVPAPAPEDIPFEAGLQLGSYRVEKVIGEGTMGRVYLARHITLDRPAALKVLHARHTQDAGLVQRFFQEARLVNRIAHEHIVEVFDFVESLEPRLVYGVMELLTGDTLAARLAARPLPLDIVVHIGRQIAQALQAAHAVGVVHRDVKPENVFLVKRGGRDDYVKVLDFGVAKLSQTLGPSAVVSTNTGSVIGTPRYMAPEQAAGLDVDASTDIWALGVILYEMLAGKVPFESLSFGQLAADIITKPPPPLPERSAAGEVIPPALRDLVLACLQKQPELRPATMTSVDAWLERALDPNTASAATPSPRSRLALRAGLAAGAAAVLGLVLFFALRPAAPVAPVTAPVVAAVEKAPTPAPPPEKPANVSLMLTTTPAGARLIRADTGEVIGTTPFSGALPRSSAPLRLRIEAAGHEPLLRDVSLASDSTLDLSLKPVRVKGPVKKQQPADIRNGVIDPF